MIRRGFTVKRQTLAAQDDAASSARSDLTKGDMQVTKVWGAFTLLDGQRTSSSQDLKEHIKPINQASSIMSKALGSNNQGWAQNAVQDVKRLAAKGSCGTVETSRTTAKQAVFDLTKDAALAKQALSTVIGSAGFIYIKNQPADLKQPVWWNTGFDAFFIDKTYKTIYEQHIPDPPLPPPPDQEVYKIVNTVSVVKLPERLALEVDSITVSRSLNDFAWSIGLTLLNKSSYDLVKPVGSNYVEIEVSINSKVWRFFIAQGSKQVSGLKESWSVNGFSKTKLLSEPFSTKKSFVETTESTASQLVTSEAVTQGFTVNWSTDLPDWVIPANTFTYQDKTPIAAISIVCGAIDAMVEPDLTGYSINVKPKFKHSVWNWAQITPDYVINQSSIMSESDSYSPKSAYNAVNVIGSVWGDCKIPGSAGDNYLPDVVDDLICTEQAATERGRAELCKAVAGEVKQIQIPLDDLIVPSDMVEVVRPDTTRWRGMVEGTAIQVGGAGTSVWQTLSIRQYDE